MPKELCTVFSRSPNKESTARGSVGQMDGDREVKVMELLISNDNENWESLGNFNLANVDKTELYFDLPARKSFRYFKMKPISGHDATQQPGLAEISIFYVE